MKNYTLLLVDDEEETLQSMIADIDLTSLSFRVIGIANDGIEALDLVEKLQPNIIMTGVKIPYVNGLELIQQVKEEQPATEFLIFSSLNELDYAKETLQLKKENYILKSASTGELITTIIRLREKLDKNSRLEQDAEFLQQYQQTNFSVDQLDFYHNFLEEQLKNNSHSSLFDGGLSTQGVFYCCLVLHASVSQMPTEMNPSLLTTSVERYAKKYFTENWQETCFSYAGDTVMLVQLCDEDALNQLMIECTRFCKFIHQKINATVTIGVGQVCTSISALAASYVGGRLALSYRGMYGSSRVINIRDIAPHEVERLNRDNSSEFIDLLKNTHIKSQAEIEERLYAFLNHVDNLAASFSGEDIAVSEQLDFLQRNLINKTTLDFLIKNDKNFENAKNLVPKSLVVKAQGYVQEHYNSPELSLDNICEFLGVSNSYFSSLFKKKTGMSFIGYLTAYRLDRAAWMLLEYDEKSYIIGQKVGYTDPNYFSYVFKRRFGVSPQKYRMINVVGAN